MDHTLNAGEERELLGNLTTHINRIKPKQFALCYIHDPCTCGTHQGDVIAWGFVMRRGVTILDDDGTPVGLYDSVEDACARISREYRTTNTRVLWLTPQLNDPPTTATTPDHRATHTTPHRSDRPTDDRGSVRSRLRAGDG